MPSPSKVVWSQGLMMSPHHLQAQDRYHEEHLAARLDAIQPLGWGVVRCELDRRALASGELRMELFIGVLPGGATLSFGGDESEAPASRSLAGLVDGAAPVAVYLAVPRERDGQANYATDDRARYRTREQRVPDAVGESEALELALATPNLRLVVEGEPLDDVEHLQVAEIVRDEDGAFRVVDDYVPPCLTLRASTHLEQGMRRLVQALRTRHRALLASRRERDAETIGFEQADIGRYLLLQSIGTHLPVLDHLVDASDVHPREAYLHVVKLAGALSSFSTEEEPSFPRFDYQDLRATFDGLIGQVLGLLSATSREHCFPLELDARQDGMHLARVEDPKLQRASRFFLAVRGDLPETELSRLVPSLGKVASWGDIEAVLSSATPGATVEATRRPPPEIPVKAGEAYFELDATSTYWREVLRSETVAVFLPPPFDPGSTRVRIVGVPGRSGGGREASAPVALAAVGGER